MELLILLFALGQIIPVVVGLVVVVPFLLVLLLVREARDLRRLLKDSGMRNANEVATLLRGQQRVVAKFRAAGMLDGRHP